MERHGDRACAMSFRDGQQPELHTELGRADAERAAGYTTAKIRHSLCFPPHERGKSAFAAVGRCTVMYGMYGKMGRGVSPQMCRVDALAFDYEQVPLTRFYFLRSYAKKPSASLRILFAVRSSAFSRSSSRMRIVCSSAFSVFAGGVFRRMLRQNPRWERPLTICWSSGRIWRGIRMAVWS